MSMTINIYSRYADGTKGTEYKEREYAPGTKFKAVAYLSHTRATTLDIHDNPKDAIASADEYFDRTKITVSVIAFY